MAMQDFVVMLIVAVLAGAGLYGFMVLMDWIYDEDEWRQCKPGKLMSFFGGSCLGFFLYSAFCFLFLRR